jgi:HD-like signal output (HDOD) protein
MKRILFVDDETRILDGLRRMLFRMRDEWEMEFVDSGEKALARLAAVPADVVVTDMRMPGMDGSQLLREVMQRHPGTMRIVLSGQCDQETVLKAVGPTHQFLTKPCDSAALVATVSRVCALRDQLLAPQVKQVVCEVQSAASDPPLHAALLAELESPAPSMQRVSEIVSRDVGMTAKVLQLVNSGFFGTPQRASHPAQAATLLGLDRMTALALSTDAFAPLEVDEANRPWMGALLHHCRAVADAARRIAEAETADAEVGDAAYTGGLLHAIGVLLLARDAPQRYGRVIESSRGEQKKLLEAEQEEFNATYNRVGAYLLALWGLPQDLVEIIALHPYPSASNAAEFGPLAAVHVANELLHEAAAHQHPTVSPVDSAFLERIGRAQRIDVWRDLCLAASAEAVAG